MKYIFFPEAVISATKAVKGCGSWNVAQLYCSRLAFWTIVHCDLNDFDSSKGEHSIILSTCLDLTCLFRLSAQPLENSFPQWEQEKEGVLLRVFILLIPPPPTPSHLPPYFPLVLLLIYLLTSSFSSSFFLFFALIPPQFSSWKCWKFKASEIVENASNFVNYR